MGKTIVLAFGDYDTGYTDQAGRWHAFNRTWPETSHSAEHAHTPRESGVKSCAHCGSPMTTKTDDRA